MFRTSFHRTAASAFGILVLAAVFAAPGGVRAQEFSSTTSPWSVAPNLEYDEDSSTGVERTGTLRVIRFSGDRYEVTRDPGTLVGFVGTVGATGEIPKTHDEPLDEKSLLEIMSKALGR
jgi:hypothetical protein